MTALQRPAEEIASSHPLNETGICEFTPKLPLIMSLTPTHETHVVVAFFLAKVTRFKFACACEKFYVFSARAHNTKKKFIIYI